jgi:hypothetical protein
MTHPTMTASGPGTVSLDIGGGTGALIISTPARLHGRDIEVSPAADLGTRRQATVRARHVRGGIRWNVVLDRLPEGRYVVWRDAVTPLTEIDVPGGTVTEFTWPVPAAA